MSTEKSPAFQFYPTDFLSDVHVVSMNLAERGAYITLLCFCWMDQSLPVDMNALARLCRVPVANMSRLWPALEPCFTILDGRLVQPRIERERQKQENWRAAKVEAGQRGGLAKASSARKTDKQKASRGLAEASSSSSSLSSSPSPIVVPAELLRRRSGRQPPMDLNLRRLKFWRWMAEAFIDKLGEHADAFDIEAWVCERDKLETRVITGDWWDYWLPAFEAEVKRRGLPIVNGNGAARMFKEPTPEDAAIQLEMLRKADAQRERDRDS